MTTAEGDPITPNPLDASDLNLPSIGVGDLVGNQTVTRRITNVSGKPEAYHITSSGLPGVEVTSNMNRVRVPAGATKTVRITLRLHG